MSLIDSDQNKAKILKKFFEISADEGCDDKILEKSLIECGFDPNLKEIIFENGIVDLLDFASEILNQETLKEIKKTNFSNLGITAKIRKIIEIRLKLIDKNYQSFCAIILYLKKNPKNLSFSFKQSYQFANLAWYEIGDKSTDYNFYTKRILLAKIYFRILLQFSKNNSITDNLSYFDNQISNIFRFVKVKNKFSTFFNNISCQSVQDDVKNSKNFIKKQLHKIPFIRLYNGK
jgi:ubiquinone biosynthesis protein COQ9